MKTTLRGTILTLFAVALAGTCALLLWSGSHWKQYTTVVITNRLAAPQSPTTATRDSYLVSLATAALQQQQHQLEVDQGDAYTAQFEYMPSIARHRAARRRAAAERRRKNRRRLRASPPLTGSLLNKSADIAASSGSFLQLQKEHYSPALQERFPRYLIVGFAKTGTKALYELLKLHPQLSGPRREMRYFTNHYYRKNLTEYLTAFPPPGNGFTIEKSPDYILSPIAAERISHTAAIDMRLNPTTDIRLIVMLRNPVVRTVSDYLESQTWNLFNKRLRLPPFDEFVLSQEENAINGSINLINASCYSYHLQGWLRTFGINQFCFVDGDNFITDPYSETKSLEKCLHLEPYFAPSHFVYNRYKRFYCFKTSGKTLCMNGAKGRKHPFVSDQVINKLKDYFKPHNEKLYSLIGRQFDWENSMKY